MNAGKRDENIAFIGVMTITTKAKPFLRWAGSKRKQLPILAAYWSDSFQRYIEPFMGSACLFFELQPPASVLSDINTDLIRTFLTVRDHSTAVSNRIAKLRKGKASYYRIRRLRMSELDDPDAAANFIFLNRFCFNGLYRTNLDGHFNVPFGATKTGQLPSRLELRLVAAQLKTCKIICADFLKTLKASKHGDFVYLDPPFAVSNQRIFRQYDPSSFGLDDLERLASELRNMDSRGVKFVLSYADSPEAKRHFADWRRRKVLIQRNIAGFSDARRRSAELIFTNIDN